MILLYEVCNWEILEKKNKKEAFEDIEQKQRIKEVNLLRVWKKDNIVELQVLYVSTRKRAVQIKNKIQVLRQMINQKKSVLETECISVSSRNWKSQSISEIFRMVDG